MSNFQVLIVEDFDFIRGLLSSSLLELGVGRVVTAENGIEGKDKLLEHNASVSPINIDVVILDWLMPNGSGLELLRWIRAHRSEMIRFLPVVVCSGFTSQRLVEECRDNGVNEIMVKPISAEKMAQRILHVIERPRPYIKAPNFFGPERRRKDIPVVGDDRRQTKYEDIKVNNEKA